MSSRIKEYTLKAFREHYIEHRHIEKVDQPKIDEAFMAGAHTVMLMVTNAIQNDNKALLRNITQELSEYMTIKQAEAQVNRATIH